MSSSRKDAGQKGESLAAAHLRQVGYVIIETNWHCSRGEIDIIAQKDTIWVFVEVRTRHAETTESAFESISPSKRKKLIASAQLYLQAHHLENALWRIDVIAIALPRQANPQIEHLENALDW